MSQNSIINMNKTYLIIVLVSVCLVGIINGATTHKHTHSHSHGSPERTSDGSYSRRDAHHHEGGEHHTEFDHEAIIGEFSI